MMNTMVRQDFAQVNRERMLKAINHEQPDRPPVALMVNAPFFASFSNIFIKDYYTDPRKMLEAQLAVRKRFYNITPVWADGGVAVEPSALGGEVYWDTAGNPQVKPFITDLEDIDRLEVPDPSHDGWMPKQLETYDFMIRNVGKDVKVDFGYLVIGPVTIAGMIRGMSKFLTDLFKVPDAASKLLSICSDTVKVWAKAQEEVIGESTEYGIFIADDAASFVTPKQFKEFVLPLYKEIYGMFPRRTRWYHNDMKSTHILELLAEAGVEVFHIAYDVDLLSARTTVGDRICFLGNIPPLEILKDGTVQMVRDACAILIRNMAPGSFILSTGGFTNAGTPTENIDAMIESVETQT
jgi:uroporphyrinogen decarboxylase